MKYYLLGVLLMIIVISLVALTIFKPTLTGFAVHDDSGHIQKLKISSMCSDEPDLYLVWKIENKNDITIRFNWDIQDTNQNGSGIVMADSYTYLNTTTEGSNNLRIFVNGSQHDVQLGKKEKCTNPIIPVLAINSTPINETSIINPAINDNVINETLNQTNSTVIIIEQNSTKQNQTIFNETIITIGEQNITQNQTTVINQTSNETTKTIETTTETPAPTTEGYGSSGGGSNGGDGNNVKINTSKMVVGEKTEVVSYVITGKDTGVVDNPIVGTSSDSKNFLGIVGNAIKIPVDKVRGFFQPENSDYILIILASLLFVILSIVSIVRYIKLKQRQPRQ